LVVEKQCIVHVRRHKISTLDDAALMQYLLHTSFWKHNN
jgi:hypothetical protein